ncbi:MAG: ParA family protein [Thermoleophilia bacterium]|mgnify:FL=1
MSRESRERIPPAVRRITLITGHYGCGKTNFSINLALDLRAHHDRVTIVDLDVVNPYFRSSDYREMLAARGVHVIAPVFAGTTLDVPALSAAVPAALRSDDWVIVDGGGDDVGATALGAFAAELSGTDYDLLYVVNRYRNLTATPSEAEGVLREIEAASRLTATGVVNNSHLQRETTAQTVLDAVPFGRDTARLLRLPLVCTTVPAVLLTDGAGRKAAGSLENAYPVEVYVRPPWEPPTDDDER